MYQSHPAVAQNISAEYSHRLAGRRETSIKCTRLRSNITYVLAEIYRNVRREAIDQDDTISWFRLRELLYLIEIPHFPSPRVILGFDDPQQLFPVHIA